MLVDLLEREEFYAEMAKYVKTMSQEAKKRYAEKQQLLEGKILIRYPPPCGRAGWSRCCWPLYMYGWAWRNMFSRCLYKFYVEAAVRIHEKQTVAGVAAYWKLPSAKSQVKYAPIKKINFTSANSLKKRLEREIENGNEPSGRDQAPKDQLKTTYKASNGNFSKFLEEISKAKHFYLFIHSFLMGILLEQLKAIPISSY
eukprot:gene9987-18611_t